MKLNDVKIKLDLKAMLLRDFYIEDEKYQMVFDELKASINKIGCLNEPISFKISELYDDNGLKEYFQPYIVMSENLGESSENLGESVKNEIRERVSMRVLSIMWLLEEGENEKLERMKTPEILKDIHKELEKIESFRVMAEYRRDPDAPKATFEKFKSFVEKHKANAEKSDENAHNTKFGF